MSNKNKLGELVTFYKPEKQEIKQESKFLHTTAKHSAIRMSNKLLDLIKFDKFSIKKSKKNEGVIYYTGYLKNIKTWAYSNPEDKPLTRAQAIRKAKELFITDLWSGRIIELSSEENKDYFTQLQKELFSMREELNKCLYKKRLKLSDGGNNE